MKIIDKVERIAVFKTIKIGRTFYLKNARSKFEKISQRSAKSLDERENINGSICAFEPDESIRLLQDIEEMKELIFNQTSFTILPGLELIVSTDNNPSDYKEVGKVEIVYLIDNNFKRIYAEIGMSTSWNKDDFSVLNVDQLSKKIKSLLDNALIKNDDVFEIIVWLESRPI